MYRLCRYVASNMYFTNRLSFFKKHSNQSDYKPLFQKQSIPFSFYTRSEDKMVDSEKAAES